MKLLFCICGSFCCHASAVEILEGLVAEGHSVTVVLSESSASTDTRFGESEALIEKVTQICGKAPVLTIAQAEKTP